MTTAERTQLTKWVRTRTSPHRLVVRSRIVLLAGEGLSTLEVANRLRVAAATVRLWCQRFHRFGIAALERDAPGRGRPPGMSRTTVLAVLRAMAARAPDDPPLTVRRLAARAATSASTVSRICRRYHLRPNSTRDEVREVLRRVISETEA